MPKHTQQDCICAALKDLGFPEVTDKQRTRKFRVFDASKEDAGRHYYIGKAGACRRGRIRTTSYPVSVGYRKQLIDKGRKLLEGTP